MKWLLLALLLPGCQRLRALIPHQHKPHEPVSISLFAAGYCGPCKEELPAISEWYRRLSDAKVFVRVLLIAGNTPAIQPTEEVCSDFRKGLDLQMPVIGDKYARLYARYYDDGGVQIPAAVITTMEGVPLKIFKPGKITVEQLEEEIRKMNK